MSSCLNLETFDIVRFASNYTDRGCYLAYTVLLVFFFVFLANVHNLQYIVVGR